MAARGRSPAPGDNASAKTASMAEALTASRTLRVTHRSPRSPCGSSIVGARIAGAATGIAMAMQE
jgi:hypothetical protein